jgi:hypothetical protein
MIVVASDGLIASRVTVWPSLDMLPSDAHVKPGATAEWRRLMHFDLGRAAARQCHQSSRFAVCATIPTHVHNEWLYL